MDRITAPEPRLQLCYCYCYCDFIAGVAACLALSVLEPWSTSQELNHAIALTQPLVRASVDARGFFFGNLSKAELTHAIAVTNLAGAGFAGRVLFRGVELRGVS
jgi:hypothetical protein